MQPSAGRGATEIAPEQQLQFGAVFLLEHMVHGEHRFPLLLEEGDQALEPLLDWLHVRGYTEIVDDDHYEPTKKGEQVLAKFLARYDDFLRTIDIYSAVDLEEGTFAFERMFDFDDQRDWLEYIDQDRFSDLRVAVARFKKLDPVELVFMACVNDGTLSTDDDGWQKRLVHGEFWDFVADVIDNALGPEDLAYDDEQGTVPGEKVLEQVIVEGAELNLELKKREAEAEAEEHAGEPDAERDAGEVVEETVTYYQPYVDPFYVSPVWLGLWLL